MSYCVTRVLFHNHSDKIGMFRIYQQFLSLWLNQYIHVNQYGYIHLIEPIRFCFIVL